VASTSVARGSRTSPHLRLAEKSTGQDSEGLPILTRVALQTEKLQQNEPLAWLKQADSIPAALPE
jgi:hypothetical protein